MHGNPIPLFNKQPAAKKLMHHLHLLTRLQKFKELYILIKTLNMHNFSTMNT